MGSTDENPASAFASAFALLPWHQTVGANIPQLVQLLPWGAPLKSPPHAIPHHGTVPHMLPSYPHKSPALRNHRAPLLVQYARTILL